MKTDIKQDQIRFYKGLLKVYGDDPKSLFHREKESQYERFNLLARCFEREAKSFTVHEIGCSLGHFGDYLNERYPLAVFSGSDIIPEFVDKCRKRFPNSEFFLRDITEHLPTDKYDYVIMGAGTFNINGSVAVSEWQEFVYCMMLSMFNMAKKGIATTFLTGYSDPGKARKDMFYQDEKAIIDFVKQKLSRHIEIFGAGPLYEYGIAIYRPEWIRSLYKHTAFDRYFKST
jgi:hypothetical protein